MAFNLILTDEGVGNINHCIDYLFFGLHDEFAADRLYRDILSRLEILEDSAGSYPLCENEILAKKGFRKIHLKYHAYKIFYTISENNVYIRAFLHDKQDFENILKRF